MRIVAIDPGYDRCGVAVIEDLGAPIIFSECISTDKQDTHEKRLADIYNALTTTIARFEPDFIALETLFFSVNKKTAIKVAEARGAILLLAGLHGLPLLELSPQEVKLAMTGIGNASKDQVIKMVGLTLKIDTKAKIDDEIDAIALGIAAIQKAKIETVKKALAKKK